LEELMTEEQDMESTLPSRGEFTSFEFPRNAWYAVAWDHEIERSLTAVTVCDRPVALYRTSSGKVVALADACWHRLAPLSMGTLVGDDEVRCPYHGLVFDHAGRCTFMPAQKTLNPSARVRSYPCVERDRLVWVWPGDEASADTALIPDMHWLDDPEWAGDGTTTHMNCTFRLVLDNLMDLTHEQFVHSSSIGSESMSETDFTVRHDGDTVTLTRWMLDIDPPPFWETNLRDRFPGYRGRVDRWQIIRFEPPSTIVIDVGVAKAGTGAPDGDRRHGVNCRVLNTVTPETHTSCRYIWAFVRNYELSNQRITTIHRETNRRVFNEDKTMLEAQQRAIADNPDLDFYNLNIDAGTMWMRRVLDRMVDEELASTDLRQP
jgi:vanillate O-demethylase monooxygenase subunit